MRLNPVVARNFEVICTQYPGLGWWSTAHARIPSFDGASCEILWEACRVLPPTRIFTFEKTSFALFCAYLNADHSLAASNSRRDLLRTVHVPYTPSDAASVLFTFARKFSPEACRRLLIALFKIRRA